VHSRLRRSAVFRNAVAASIRRADLVNVPSKAVRQELPRWVPGIPLERIRVTPYGIDGRFCVAPAGEVAEHINRMRMPQPYVLFVGTIEPRKNLPMLLEGFRRFLQFGRRTYHLVLAGRKGWDSETVYRLAASPELAGRVHFLGYIPDDDLPWVYRGASAFLYPSLYEGFGFPPLEAMACGVPVITSQGSSLEENLRGVATMVPPSNPDALAHALDRLLTHESHRREQIRMGLDRAREFHWNRTAQLVVNCYRELAEQARGNACSRIPSKDCKERQDSQR
jgi:glycosyltransferase involved in cell wall biosynthesis